MDNELIRRFQASPDGQTFIALFNGMRRRGVFNKDSFREKFNLSGSGCYPYLKIDHNRNVEFYFPRHRIGVRRPKIIIKDFWTVINFSRSKGKWKHKWVVTRKSYGWERGGELLKESKKMVSEMGDDYLRAFFFSEMEDLIDLRKEIESRYQFLSRNIP